MKKIWRALRSLRLAISLIVIVTLGSVLATLIPQNLSAERYQEMYPKLLALLINETGLSHYFTSLIFILPILAFFVNLGACTLSRLHRELKKKKAHHHGPDLLHIGLLILIVGSLISFSERKEGTANLKAGDSLELPGGKVLTLVSFEEERYADGRPKDWISIIDLSKDGKKLIEGRPIRVNSPLRTEGLTLYQASYATETILSLTGIDGIEHQIARGASFKNEDFEVFFMTMDEGPSTENSPRKAVLRVKGTKLDGIFRVGDTETVMGTYSAQLKTSLRTGLQAVVDPGFKVVLVGLILISLGTALTFVQKIKGQPTRWQSSNFDGEVL